MSSTIENQIMRFNHLITREQERLNQQEKIPKLFSFVSSGQANQYPGSCDEISEILNKRQSFVENRKALIDDILFILHNTIRSIVESDCEEEKKVQIVKTLEENKALCSKRARHLHELDLLYQSILIEPAIIKLEDGERGDPDHFHIFINPSTDLSQEEGDLLTVSWWKLLERLEEKFATPLELKTISE